MANRRYFKSEERIVGTYPQMNDVSARYQFIHNFQYSHTLTHTHIYISHFLFKNVKKFSLSLSILLYCILNVYKNLCEPLVIASNNKQQTTLISNVKKNSSSFRSNNVLRRPSICFFIKS